jgi:hypothetical protein
MSNGIPSGNPSILAIVSQTLLQYHGIAFLLVSVHEGAEGLQQELDSSGKPAVHELASSH